MLGQTDERYKFLGTPRVYIYIPHVHTCVVVRVLQCVEGCCRVSISSVLWGVCCSVLQYVAVRCSVLQCVAVCCSVLQCVAVCCSVLQCVAVRDVTLSPQGALCLSNAGGSLKIRRT